MRAGVFVVALCLTWPAYADPDVLVPEGYRLDAYRSAVPDSVPGATVFDTASIRALIQAGEAVLVDVLPAARRPDGMRPGTPWLPVRHQTLPGSLWWPEVGRGALSDEMEQRFRDRLTQVASPGKTVVFFCLSDCWMSWNAARRAGSYGVRAGWYPDGTDGWARAGLPLQEASPELE